MANRTDVEAQQIHGTNPQVSCLRCNNQFISRASITNAPAVSHRKDYKTKSISLPFSKAKAFFSKSFTRAAQIHECTYWKEHCFGLSAEGVARQAFQSSFPVLFPARLMQQ
jgi:hypothetical protein